jgi:very-short-patch-repair endonuclease
MRGAQPWRTNRTRVLRSRATSAESRLWSELRSRRLNGLKFVRQCPIGPYIVDFACRDRRIIVEIDGATHSTAEEQRRDALRADYLRAQGFRIFRANNGDVYDNLNGVLVGLLAFMTDETG